jgi:hypothetical protein
MSLVSSDEQANLDLLVQSAQERLQRQLADGDAMDAKALGLAGLSVAAVALLAATHQAINRFWWIPAIGFAVASALLWWVIQLREFDVGPDLEWLYDHWTADGTSAPDAARQMLSELGASLEKNYYEVILRKGRLFNAGNVVLGLSLLGSIPIALVRP